MSRRLYLIAVPVAALGLVFAVALLREIFVSRPLPPPPVARGSQAAGAPGPVAGPVRGAGGDLGAYSMVPARSIFSPTRSETATVAAAKPAGRPILHGVVLDGPRSRAYLEDSLVKGVFGYTVGDTVGQGQITTINSDRIMISGPEGTYEVLLNDPSKPKPGTPGVVPAQPRQPGVPAPPGASATPVGPAGRRPGPAGVVGPQPGQQPADSDD
jgi:hypothetical protein